jgi:thiol:disulfide interchange protein DsbD
MGMGAPLLAIGTSAGKLLPKAGGWMDTIKSVFGIMLLAVAIWMLERILPVEVIMLMIAALAIISAIYLGALEPVGAGATGWRKFWKGSGLIMFVYGVLLIIGAAAGTNSYMQPLHGIAGGGGGAQSGASNLPHLAFKRIKGLQELNREIVAANAQNKPVMLDFYADWCISCKEMEKYTFSDPGVQEILSKAVMLQADVTKNDAIDKALLKRFKLVGPPSIMFFGTDGEERRKYRVIGFMKAEKFRKVAAKGLQQ